MVLQVLDHFERSKIHSRVNKEILNNLQKEDLTCIKFTIDNNSILNWENDHEFEYQGKMYDVVTFEMIDDVIYYYCWPDHDETALNQKMDDVLEMLLGTDNEDEEDKEVLAKLYKSLFPTSIDDFIFIDQTPEISFEYYQANFSSLESSPPSPPPQIG